jgi:hypothetical protein
MDLSAAVCMRELDTQHQLTSNRIDRDTHLAGAVAQAVR